MRGAGFRFVDLFAGLGGFHVALSQLGGRSVFASEWVPQLQDLYERNFGLLPHGDIRDVDEREIPDHEVLCAGFPCQPFSKAGDQLGFEDTQQGQLFFEVVRILDHKRPNFILLENVPNLTRHKGGATLRTMESHLQKLGYDVAFAKFSPHDFGVPQTRERLYIVGALHGLGSFRWPEKQRDTTSIRTVLDTRPIDAKPVSASLLEVLHVWQKFLAASGEAHLPSWPIWSMEFGATYPYEGRTPWKRMGDRGHRALGTFRGSYGQLLKGLNETEQMERLPSHARRQQDEFPLWKQDFIRKNRAYFGENERWIAPWLPSVKPLPMSHQKFEWNTKGEERDIFRFVIQVRASGIRVKRPTSAPSLIAMTDTQVPIIGWERRYMTPRECSRLQSLGSIELPKLPGEAYKALGNAVNADVVRAIAVALLDPSPAPSTSVLVAESSARVSDRTIELDQMGVRL